MVKKHKLLESRLGQKQICLMSQGVGQKHKITCLSYWWDTWDIYVTDLGRQKHIIYTYNVCPTLAGK